MYYSITFTNAQGVKKNTWADWGLIPTTPPMVEPPPVAANYVEIPGGPPIDVTEWLSGKPAYNNSEGSWVFVASRDPVNRTELFREMMNFLHGQQLRIEFEEDPLHYRIGRISLTSPSTGDIAFSIEIGYTINPIRYLYDGTQDGV